MRYTAFPAWRAISYCMDDDQLRNVFAEPLIYAMNSETVENVHPTYVETIKQISSYAGDVLLNYGRITFCEL
ncbi:Abi-alpha family protein [Dorea formicigenerans]